MANTGNDSSPELKPELRKRFPRAGYWFRMWPTHPGINPETTSAHSPGHNAAQDDATPQATPSTVEPQGDHELALFINLLTQDIFVNSISYLLNPSQH